MPGFGYHSDEKVFNYHLVKFYITSLRKNTRHAEVDKIERQMAEGI
jgi:hypothetical protein